MDNPSACAACSTAGAAAQDFSVVNPRCEYRDEPLGYQYADAPFLVADQRPRPRVPAIGLRTDRGRRPCGRRCRPRQSVAGKGQGRGGAPHPLRGQGARIGQGVLLERARLERCGRSLALDAGQPLLDGADVARRMVGSPLDRHGGAARQPASGAGRGV